MFHGLMSNPVLCSVKPYQLYLKSVKFLPEEDQYISSYVRVGTHDIRINIASLIVS